MKKETLKGLRNSIQFDTTPELIDRYVRQKELCKFTSVPYEVERKHAITRELVERGMSIVL